MRLYSCDCCRLADQLPKSHKDLTSFSLLTAGKWMSSPELAGAWHAHACMHTAWRQAELDLQQQGVIVNIGRELHNTALGKFLCLLAS